MDVQEYQTFIQEEVERVDAEHLAREGSPRSHPELDRLIRTIWRLRQEDGCPWDIDQTHASIRRNMIEEAYEAAEAIDQDAAGEPLGKTHLIEELGDVLEQVLLHAQIAADDGAFTIDDIARSLNEKLVRRHPHVFGEEAAQDPESALAAWNSVKQLERELAAEQLRNNSSDPATSHAPNNEGGSAGSAAGSAGSAGDTAACTSTGLLDSIPHSLPALMQCQKISTRAAAAGFEWDTCEDAWRDVLEEIDEFHAEAPGTREAQEEFGDILFALVNYGRLNGIEAEEALVGACNRFRMRWALMEHAAQASGEKLDELSSDRLEELWEDAKRKLRP